MRQCLRALVTLLGSALLAEGCNDAIPGLKYMQYGVDATKLDLLIDDNSDLQAFRKNVFDFPCDGSKTATIANNPKVYNVPKQVDYDDYSTGSSEVHSSEVTTLDDFKRAISADLSFEGKYLFGSVAASGSFKSAQKELLEENKSIKRRKTARNLYYLKLRSAFSLTSALSEDFKHFVQQLPASFSQDPRAYNDFIYQFGTHYVSYVKVGGYIIETEYGSKRQSLTENDIAANVSAAVETPVWSVKANAQYNSSNKNQNTQTGSGHKVNYFGGDRNLINRQGEDAWWDSIAQRPVVYFRTIEDISSLVEDRAKRDQLQLAIRTYSARAAMNASLQWLDIFHRKGYEGGYEANQLKEELQRDLQKQNLSPEYIEAQVERAEKASSTPDWFKSSKFCLQYSYSNKMCRDNEYCAQVNYLSPDVDGCARECCTARSPTDRTTIKMKIISPSSPDWFEWEARVKTQLTSGGLAFSLESDHPQALWLRNAEICVVQGEISSCAKTGKFTKAVDRLKSYRFYVKEF